MHNNKIKPTTSSSFDFSVSPAQVNALSCLNPVLQLHRNAPGVFSHVLLESTQVSTLVAHSSISTIKNEFHIWNMQIINKIWQIHWLCAVIKNNLCLKIFLEYSLEVHNLNAKCLFTGKIWTRNSLYISWYNQIDILDHKLLQISTPIQFFEASKA